MEKYFKREKKDYKDYIMPSIYIMGCWLAPDVEILECRYWLNNWTG
jgi:hypothetical protein